MTDNNFQNLNLQQESPRQHVWLAVLLGLLTFVTTSVVAIVIALPLIFLGRLSDNLNPLVIIARILGLKELGGFFAAQIIFVVLFALLGNFGTAIISWFLSHSKKMALITFISALIFQIIAVGFVLATTAKQTQKTLTTGIENEKSFENYAAIDDEVDFELQEPFSEYRSINGEDILVSLYKTLVLIIPVSVNQPGIYQIYIQYSDKQLGNTPLKHITQVLNAGNNIVRIEFLSNESRNYGYSSPKSVGGTTRIELSYLIAQKKLLESLQTNGNIDPKLLQQFIKDEGFDNGINSELMVSKFVGRKEVQF